MRTLANCDCGCILMSIEKYEEYNNEYIITFYISAFRNDQHGFWYKFKNRLKLIWNILKNGTHRYQEICMSEEMYNEFKEYINKK